MNSDNAEQLAVFIRAHGVEAYADVDTIMALSVWTKDGQAGQSWERLSAERAAVREWLGY